MFIHCSSKHTYNYYYYYQQGSYVPISANKAFTDVRTDLLTHPRIIDHSPTDTPTDNTLPKYCCTIKNVILKPTQLMNVRTKRKKKLALL